MANIHPTAIVDPSAQLGDDVEIGPYCIVEADTAVGASTVLRPHSIIRRHTTLGDGNFVDSFVVLGGWPQDTKFDPDQVSYLRIGDRNMFREGVTISRATGEGLATTVGSGTMWMNNSHAACVLGGEAMIHQFTWVGERVMFQGHAAIGMHAPPFVMLAMDNQVVALNIVGMKRAPDLTDADRKQIKEAFRITYRSNLKPVDALAEMDTRTDWDAAAGRFREFVRKALAAEPPYQRGLVPMLSRTAARRGRKT
ncbi:MAG: acyl-ACP--UDP-N-acetylglucosamine O-acyltransferase [Planctomycetota bacterium]|jgi:UDP-N-acetylglucosamine acyltransferase